MKEGGKAKWVRIERDKRTRRSKENEVRGGEQEKKKGEGGLEQISGVCSIFQLVVGGNPPKYRYFKI